MKYLVMECHIGYAVVLDSNGAFYKVANMGYEVGQSVSDVVKMKEQEQNTAKKILSVRRVRNLAAIAACLLILLIPMKFLVLSSYGEVTMTINPEVAIQVNRLDYVTGVEARNEDGEVLLKDYSFRFKKAETVTDELADLAVEYGYLKEGGTIRIQVISAHEKWRGKLEETILQKLGAHMGETIHISIGTKKDMKTETIKTPGGQSQTGKDGEQEQKQKGSTSGAVKNSGTDAAQENDTKQSNDDENTNSQVPDAKKEAEKNPAGKETQAPKENQSTDSEEQDDDDEEDDDQQEQIKDSDDSEDSDDNEDSDDGEDSDDSDDDNDLEDEPEEIEETKQSEEQEKADDTEDVEEKD